MRGRKQKTRRHAASRATKFANGGGRRVARGPLALPEGLVRAERLKDGRYALVFKGRSELLAESLAPSGDSPAPRRARSGTGGTTILSGKIRYEEFNPDLENEKGYGQYSRQGVYDKMRRQSTQVQRLLWLAKLPVEASTPAVEADSRCEDAELATEIADLCFMNLLEVIPGKQRIREALTMLEFGFSAFEALADGVDVPRSRFPNLAPGRSGRPRAGERIPATLFTDFELRPAKTVDGWVARKEKTTQVAELLQWVGTTDAGAAPGRTRIPGEWLLRFTFQQEGGNFQGTSLLRPVYKPFVLLDTLETVDAIRHERQNCGVPKITLPQYASDDDVDKAEEILLSLAAHEKGYLILDFGWEFEWDTSGGNGSGTNIAERIEQLKGDIADAALSRFMSLGGEGGTGSWALSETQADRHLDLISTIAELVEHVMNCGSDGWSPIRRIVDWNYGPQDYYPRFCLKDLRSKDDWAAVLPLLAQFIQAGPVPKTYQLAAEILRRLRIPLTVLPPEEEWDAQRVAAEKARQEAEKASVDPKEDVDEEVDEKEPEPKPAEEQEASP